MTSPDSTAVLCTGIRKHFGEDDARVEVLRGVDYTVRRGELSFLVGPSGCGKTTLISVIAGLLETSSGEVSLFGNPLARMPHPERVLFRRSHLGFVFQQYNLLQALTAAENAAIPLLAAGVRRREAVDRAGALLDRLGLGSKTGSYPRQLSGGQQQRALLARALVQESSLFLLDEPLNAVDEATRDIVDDVLHEHTQQGGTVLVATHDLGRLSESFDQAIYLREGRIDRIGYLAGGPDMHASSRHSPC